ncbi:MAG: Gfo/Idh/MocA family protein [Armatimonadota bacterium]
MKKLKIGLIGAGDIAFYAHMPSFEKNPKVNVAAVADSRLGVAEALAEKFGIENVYADYRELLNDQSINTVDVCVPHFLHHQVVMDALNAGKNVILEKPIAMNLEEADQMIETAKERGVKLFVALNQRFLPIHSKVKEMLENGQIGKAFLVNMVIVGNVMGQLNDGTHWKNTWELAGGGVLFDTGTHIVDIMRYWFGEPTSVVASLKRLMSAPDNKADDNACVIFEYDNDLIVNMTVSYTVENEAWSEKKFVYGSNGNVSLINEAAVPMFYLHNSEPELIDVEHNANWHSWSVDRGLTHLVDCILGEAEPLVTAEDARNTLKAILGAYESSEKGCRIDF